MSFGRQPEALFWNLARLADCLLTLAPQARLESALSGFGPALQEAFAAVDAFRTTECDGGDAGVDAEG